MDYAVEEVSPVKRRIRITADAKEVEAAVMGAVAMYRTSVKMDGFRPGKAPASVLERRFHDQIYAEARQDLINVHINEVMQKLDVTPVGGLNLANESAFSKESAFTYDMEFEILPVFALPAYEGMEVEQEKVLVTDEEVNEVIERIRVRQASLVPVDGNGPAADGQIANIDFVASENGVPVPGLHAEGFDLALGEHQALDDFEALVKTVPLNGEAEGDIAFPADFLNPDLAGRTVSMKVKVHSIKERRLPELTDEFAKRGGAESMAKMRENIAENCRRSQELLKRGVAQKKLLDSLLKMVDFPLPEAIVDIQARSLLADMRVRLERQGRSLASLGRSEEDLLKEMRPQAEEIARGQVFLLAVAKREGLDVSTDELQNQITQIAIQTREDPREIWQSYERSGMLFVLRDRMLADKGMDAVYAKAKVVEVEPAPAAQKEEG